MGRPKLSGPGGHPNDRAAFGLSAARDSSPGPGQDGLCRAGTGCISRIATTRAAVVRRSLDLRIRTVGPNGLVRLDALEIGTAAPRARVGSRNRGPVATQPLDEVAAPSARQLSWVTVFGLARRSRAARSSPPRAPDRIHRVTPTPFSRPVGRLIAPRGPAVRTSSPKRHLDFRVPRVVVGRVHGYGWSPGGASPT